jgi:hypothetical protein
LIEGGSELTEFDVRVNDLGVWNGRLKCGWNTRAVRASSTGDTRSSWVSSSWVWGIEPKKVNCVVVPERQDKNVSSLKRLSHNLKTSKSLEVVGITEDGLLLCAVGVGDVIDGVNSRPVGVGVGDDITILNIPTFDGIKVTRGGTGVSNELSDDREFLGGINGLAWTIEGGISHTIGVEIATVTIANTAVSVTTSRAASNWV